MKTHQDLSHPSYITNSQCPLLQAAMWQSHLWWCWLPDAYFSHSLWQMLYSDTKLQMRRWKDIRWMTVREWIQCLKVSASGSTPIRSRLNHCLHWSPLIHQRWARCNLIVLMLVLSLAHLHQLQRVPRGLEHSFLLIVYRSVLQLARFQSLRRYNWCRWSNPHQRVGRFHKRYRYQVIS